MVTRADAARLLALVQAFDHRNVAESDVHAWADALADLEPEDCQAAIRSYFRDQTVWLMPAAVRQRVKAIRETQAERDHRANLRKMLDAPRDPDASREGYLAATEALSAALSRDQLAALEVGREAAARTVRCPFCKAPQGFACQNNGAMRATSHPSRAELAQS